MAKKTTKKKTTKKAAAKKSSSKKRVVTKKVEQAQPATQPVKVVDHIDQLWDEVKKLHINVFGNPRNRIDQFFRRVRGIPGVLCVMPTVGAALPALETAFQSYVQEITERTPEGDPRQVEYPLYELEEMDGGYLKIKRYVPPAQRPELQPVHSGVITVVPPK